MRTRTLLLTLVVTGIGAQTALGVCGPTAAKTLAVTESARIYEQPGVAVGKPAKIIGCHLETGGAPVVLAQAVTRRVKAGTRFVQQKISVQQPRINGYFAAVAVRNFDALGRGRTTIRVADLRTGVTQFTSTRTNGTDGRPRDWNVSDLVVSYDSRAAWISAFRPDPSRSTLWIRTFTGVAPIDTGAMDPTSLELVEDTEESGVVNVGINYTKDGGTLPGNSSLG